MIKKGRVLKNIMTKYDVEEEVYFFYNEEKRTLIKGKVESIIITFTKDTTAEVQYLISFKHKDFIPADQVHIRTLNESDTLASVEEAIINIRKNLKIIEAVPYEEINNET